MFLPGVVSKAEGPIAALTIGTTGGGTNWPGSSYDPETHIVYAQAANTGIAPIGLVEPPAGFSDIRYVAGTAGQPFVEREGPGFGDRKSTRLNSSHITISYAVFCLKKKKKKTTRHINH